MIVDLENYIQLVDDVRALEKTKNEYKQIINKLQLLEDYNNEEQVNSIVEEYLRR